MSARALRILRRVAEKQPEMFQTCLASGLKVTADFHERLRSSYHASTSASTAGAPSSYLSCSAWFFCVARENAAEFCSLGRDGESCSVWTLKRDLRPCHGAIPVASYGE